MIGCKAPGLPRDLPKVLGERKASDEQDCGDGKFCDDQPAEPAAGSEIECRAAPNVTKAAAQISAGRAPGGKEADADPNKNHHARREGEDRPIEPGGVVKFADGTSRIVRAFRAERDQYGGQPFRDEQPAQRAGGCEKE